MEDFSADKEVMQDFTRRFKYCYLDLSQQWQKLNEDSFLSMKAVYEKCNKLEIQADLLRLEYFEFLRTAYWKAIAYRVKFEANFRCSLCNSKKLLNVHHRTYATKGTEIDNMKDLTCLCEKCHAKHHNK